MERPFWHRQTTAQPLFPELEWSRHGHRAHAGKLLIVGGNAHGFAAPAAAYNQAVQAGIGTASVFLPVSLQKHLRGVSMEVAYGPATPSGSLSQRALGDLLELSKWAEGILLAGDLGRNSETAVLLEKLTVKYPGPLLLTRDASDYAISMPGAILERRHTLLVLSLSQLQRLGQRTGLGSPVTFGMNLLQLVDWLHEFSTRFEPFIIVKHLDNLFVAAGGQVSTTKLSAPWPIWRLRTAAYAAVWLLQNPAKPFQALTTAVYAALGKSQ